MAVGDRNEARLNDSGLATTQLSNTATTIATVPSSRVYVIKQIIICNTDGVDRLFSLSIGSASNTANRFMSLMPIAAYDTIIYDTGMVLTAGETLQGISDTASKVNITALGWIKEV